MEVIVLVFTDAPLLSRRRLRFWFHPSARERLLCFNAVLYAGCPWSVRHPDFIRPFLFPADLPKYHTVLLCSLKTQQTKVNLCAEETWKQTMNPVCACSDGLLNYTFISIGLPRRTLLGTWHECLPFCIDEEGCNKFSLQGLKILSNRDWFNINF